jgi:DNA-nicking Smr family endonuclease
MKRKPRPDELKLWAVITATVNPAAGRKSAEPPVEDEATAKAPPQPTVTLKPFVADAHKTSPRPQRATPPQDIEPGRKRRLTRERDPIDLTLDLHGLDQDRARAVLIGFLKRAQAEGERAVLVITGKGWLGDGVLRKRAPDWLAAPELRSVVAGVSEAHKRHGGQGALYVALKRKTS